MSSLLALQTKNTIVFASDTALSTRVKDKRYRVGNNETKLFEYPDFIMFASGKKYLRDMFIDILSDSPTISDIQSVLDTYIIQHSEEYSLEIVIAMKDLSKLIFFSSTDGFSYSENLPSEYTNLFTAGCLTNEVASKFEDNYSNHPLLQSLQNTYKELSCDEIGGNLDVIILEKDNIRKLQFPIDSRETYSDEKVIELLNLVFANKLHGRILLSNKLWVEDDLGVVEIQSGLQTIYDQSGNPRVYLGRYPTFENPSQFNYGLRVIDGAFDIRTSSTSNSGIVINGNSISAFNNNSVKTFNVDAVTGKVSIIGSLSIKTSLDSNRGTLIDDSGLTVYGNSGQIVFRADHFGNIFYTGKLDGAYGNVQDLTGSISQMNGTFKGDLVASGGTFTGTLNGVDGTFTGTLSAASGSFSGELTAATGTFNGVVTGSIQADVARVIEIDIDQLRANNAQINDLSAISSNLGSITGGSITIDTDMKIGNNLYIGNSSDWASEKSIIFAGSSGITYRSDTLSITAIGEINLEATRVNIIGELYVNGSPIS